MTKNELFKLPIHNFQIDSRKIQPGDVFVCLSGDHHDGHQYIDQAQKKGAIAAITAQTVNTSLPYLKLTVFYQELAEILSRFYPEYQKLIMIGVTGTNGKTSVAYLVKQLLDLSGNPCGYIGTLGNYITNFWEETIYTTPDIVTMYQLLEKIGLSKKAAAIECSSHALKQQRLAGINFDIAIFTNFSPDHLDYHKTLDDYLNSKLLLFKKLKPHGKAVINLDDPQADHFIKIVDQPVTYSLVNKNADLYVEKVDYHQGSNFIKLNYLKQSYAIETFLLGKFNIANLLAVIATGLCTKMSMNKILSFVPHLKGVPGRFETYHQSSTSPLVIVDFAHSVDSLVNMIHNARPLCPGDLYLIFGITGDRIEAAKNMSEEATSLVDLVCFTTDNPLGIPVMDIINEMEAGAKCPYQSIPDRRKAIESILKKAKAMDLVLICGKGPENYQYMHSDKSKKTPYPGDMQIVKKWFAKKKRK
ncbi:MAG: UDP-N-acetylmuramoyl-L-alanyl-D-glutamate--2,6-diaminopimelate ligase [Spirochaetes bacterium]|nr:UDP-N-acetylmuramoyl-L-alanyl-D-glutamate--2,6-diaminopimelate ligase [Spirochaetota bacterium]